MALTPGRTALPAASAASSAPGRARAPSGGYVGCRIREGMWELNYLWLCWGAGMGPPLGLETLVLQAW